MITYKTNKTEIKKAFEVAKARQRSCSNIPDSHDYEGDPLHIHKVGALGELIFSKVFDFEWSRSVDTFKSEPDVDKYEVRTRTEHWHDLIVRKDDSDESPFALVTGDWRKDLEYRVHGWILGGDAKEDKWLKGYGGREPAWFVPKIFLSSFGEAEDPFDF